MPKSKASFLFYILNIENYLNLIFQIVDYDRFHPYLKENPISSIVFGAAIVLLMIALCSLPCLKCCCKKTTAPRTTEQPSTKQPKRGIIKIEEVKMRENEKEVEMRENEKEKSKEVEEDKKADRIILIVILIYLGLFSFEKNVF